MQTLNEIDEIKALKGFKCCHLNAQHSKIDQFKLHFENSAFDVITVSETWQTEDVNTSILNMKGFQLLRADRCVLNNVGLAPKKGGGLLIYVRDNINYPMDYNGGQNISNAEIEIERLELRSSVQKNILIYNVYRPPNGSVDKGLEIIGHLLDNEENLHRKEVLILGDFNIN